MTTSFDKQEFPRYQGGQNASLWLTAVLWALALGGLLALRRAVATGEPLIWAPAGLLVFLLVGWCQASLSNGFHEAVHRNFGARHSDLLSLLVLGFPTFFTMHYRTVHLAHHQHFGDPVEDPDFSAFSPFPRSRWEMIGHLVLMGSGLAAAHQLITRNLRRGEDVTGRKRSQVGKPLARELVGLALVQLAILGLFALIFGVTWAPLWYLGFWILPLGMVAKLLKSMRAVCEHASPDRPFVLRTITGRPWQTITLGTYGFHYHGEHHLWPWVAYGSLAPLHERVRDELLADPDTAEGHYEHYEGGYLSLLAKWFRELPWRRSPDALPAAQRAR